SSAAPAAHPQGGKSAADGPPTLGRLRTRGVPSLSRLTERLRLLPPEILGTLARGIEKESLRADTDGRLAETPHPAGLGSALTHPHITTDFSESQLELITGVPTGIRARLAELRCDKRRGGE